MEECKFRYENRTVYGNSESVCGATFDGVLCWPPVPAGSKISQNCPNIFGFDNIRYAYKACLENGDANGADGEVFSISDYTECIHSTSVLDYDVYDEGAIDQSKHILAINKLGISLLVISLISVILTLLISKFLLPVKTKYANHVKIHVHLFASILIMESLLLTLQTLNFIGMETGLFIAAEIPFICEILIALNKYADITTIMWVTLDAHFIYVMVTSGHLTVSGYIAYCITGWGLPSVPTTIWAITLAVSHRTPCWFGHTFLPVGWLLEACKIALLLMCIYLFAIANWKFRSLTRVRNENKSESKKCENDLSLTSSHEKRKVRYRLKMAILFFMFTVVSQLIILVTTHAPLPISIVWQYVLTVLTSCRGLVLSVIYCYYRIRLRRRRSCNRRQK